MRGLVSLRPAGRQSELLGALIFENLKQGLMTSSLTVAQP